MTCRRQGALPVRGEGDAADLEGQYETDQYRLWQHGFRGPSGCDCQPGIGPDQAHYPGGARPGGACGRDLRTAHTGGYYYGQRPCRAFGDPAGNRCGAHVKPGRRGG